ncbi:MAG: hypothetical protein AAF288_07250 [Planctomycetota bacterium]
MPQTVTQTDIHQLEASLTEVRDHLHEDRAQSLVKVTELQERAAELKELAEASDSAFEPAVSSVHALLDTLRRNLEAGEALRRMAA